MKKIAKAQYATLPSSIRIGQRDIDIIVSNNSKDVSLETAHAYTLTDFDRIVIIDNLSAGQLRATLLHEILHAIRAVYENDESQVKSKDEDESYRDYALRWEHYYIYLVTEPLTQIIRDNPKLIEFLQLDPTN